MRVYSIIIKLSVEVTKNTVLSLNYQWRLQKYIITIKLAVDVTKRNSEDDDEIL